MWLPHRSRLFHDLTIPDILAGIASEHGLEVQAELLEQRDTRIAEQAECDLGIATQNLLLGAMEKGIGGCRIGAFSPKLADIFKLEQHQELSLVVALGYPAEQVVIETSRDGDIKYWRDENELHHVPKRELSEILTVVEFK